jgi:hypothetical protein
MKIIPILIESPLLPLNLYRTGKTDITKCGYNVSDLIDKRQTQTARVF